MEGAAGVEILNRCEQDLGSPELTLLVCAGSQMHWGQNQGVSGGPGSQVCPSHSWWAPGLILSVSLTHPPAPSLPSRRAAGEPAARRGGQVLRGAMGLLRAPPRQQRGHIPQIHGVRVAPFPPPRPPPPSPEAEPLPPLPPPPPPVPPVPPAPLPVLAAGLCGVSPRQQQDQTVRAGPDAPPHHGVLLERARRRRRGTRPGDPPRPGGERGTGRVTQRAEPTSKENARSFSIRGAHAIPPMGGTGLGVAHTHPRTSPKSCSRGASPW